MVTTTRFGMYGGRMMRDRPSLRIGQCPRSGCERSRPAILASLSGSSASSGRLRAHRAQRHPGCAPAAALHRAGALEGNRDSGGELVARLAEQPAPAAPPASAASRRAPAPHGTGSGAAAAALAQRPNVCGFKPFISRMKTSSWRTASGDFVAFNVGVNNEGERRIVSATCSEGLEA